MDATDSMRRVLRSHDRVVAETAQLNRDLHDLVEALAARPAGAGAPTTQPMGQVPPVRPQAVPAPATPWRPPVQGAPRFDEHMARGAAAGLSGPAAGPGSFPPPVGRPAGAPAPVSRPAAVPSPVGTPTVAAPVGGPASFPGPAGAAAARATVAPGVPGGAATPPLGAPLWAAEAASNVPAAPLGSAVAARLGISRTQLVSRLVAGVGAVVTLVGVAFILVLAAQYGYFGPLARTIASGALGAALAAVAFVIHRRDAENAGAHALLATGAAAGYLGLYAAGSLYGFLPDWAALLCTAVLGLAVVAVAVVWRSQWLAALGVASASLVGAYLGGNPRVGVSFAVVLSVVTILAQLRVSWPAFLAARTLPAFALLSVAAAAATPGTGIDTVLLTVVAGVFALAGLLSAWVGRRGGRSEQIVSALLVTLAPVPAMYAAWQLGQVWGSTALAALAAAYLVTGALPLLDRVPRSAVIPVGALLVTVAGLRLAGGDHATTVLAAVAAAYASVALYSRSRLVAVAATVLGTAAVLGWVVPALQLVFLARYAAPVGTSLFLAAWTLLTYLAWPSVLQGTQPRWFRNIAVVLGLVAASATVDAVGVLVGRNLDAVATGYRVASATATVLWALASVMALWVPLRRAAKAGWVTLGLSLAAAATAKLFLIDLSTLTGMARGMAFLGVGLLLLVLGVGYAKAYEAAKDRATAPVPGAPASVSSPSSPATAAEGELAPASPAGGATTVSSTAPSAR